MNLKSISRLFVVISFLFLISSTLLAVPTECNQANIGVTITNASGQICVCQPTNNNTNMTSPTFKFVCSDDNDIGAPVSVSNKNFTKNIDDKNQDVNTRPMMKNINSENQIHSELYKHKGNITSLKDCRAQINKLNEKIRNSNNSINNQTKEYIKEITKVRKEILELRKKYRFCVSGKLKQKSPMSGEFVLNGNLSEDSNSIESDNSLTMEINNSADVSVNNNMIDRVISENKKFIDYNLGLSNIPKKCLEIRSKINNKNQQLDILITRLNDFKEKNISSIKNVRELVNERNQLMKKCYPKLPKIVDNDCEVPNSLIENQNDFLKRIKEVKEKLKDMDSNSEDYKFFMNEYRKNTLGYRLAYNKIQAIRKECVSNSSLINNPKNLCDSKLKLINEKNEIVSKLKEMNNSDEKEVYVLKRKLDYINTKIDNTVCADFVSAKPSKAIDIGNIPKNQFAACVTDLIKDSNIPKESAISKCKDKFSLEKENTDSRIKELQVKIRAQQKTIESLKNKMESLRNKFKNAKTKQSKEKLLKDNAQPIKEDTIAKIDNSITRLQKVIDNINASDMNQDRKDTIINLVNEKIAHLQMVKDNLSSSETVVDFKDGLKKAREYDLNAKKVMVVGALKSNVSQMNNIINKYFVNNKDYNSLKAQVDSLKSDLDLLDMQNIDVHKVNRIRENYNKLKARLKSYAASGVNAE